MILDFLTFRGHGARKEFLIFGLIFPIVMTPIVIFGPIAAFPGDKGGLSMSPSGEVLFAILICFTFYILISSFVRRTRDIFGRFMPEYILLAHGTMMIPIIGQLFLAAFLVLCPGFISSEYTRVAKNKYVLKFFSNRLVSITVSLFVFPIAPVLFFVAQYYYNLSNL
ncbi:hypothetical protein BALOs_1717 [Halobacteriovorax sp. BALOs_7]|uniref:DUF805 domain-containing protein n=1 Tax=unclassified Halobacteriovorax TaxID=2639665 RepID=UPI000EA33CBC|nr:hypothetical protein BALOs_1717 [Halobacteriovorax sp. BALOs_7]